MSDYHIRSADVAANSFEVVMHIPVPAADNQVSVSYRDALVEMLGGADAIVTDYAAEEAQLKAGELYEHRLTFNSNPGQDLAAKRDALDALYTSEVTRVQGILQNQLAYWGYSRDVS